MVYLLGKRVDPLSGQATHRQNEKNLTHLLNQPWLKGQSVQYNQPLSYIGIFEITFSEILSMRRYFLLCFRTAAYN